MIKAAEMRADAQPSDRLRCIFCGAVPERAEQTFRCAACGELLEICYPAWEKVVRRPSVSMLKSAWRERKMSSAAADQSGVWRFRDLLPAIDARHVVTMREGNTPVYELPACCPQRGVDHILAKHQGMNPSGSFKDTGMTVAISAARQEKFQLGGVRIHGKHVGLDGGVRRSRWNSQPGVDSGRLHRLGQAFAVARLWRAHLPAPH